MKRTLILLIAVSFSLGISAQKYLTASKQAQKTMKSLQNQVQDFYGDYGPVAETARVAIAKQLNGGIVTTIGWFPYVTKGYYLVKQPSRTYLVEYNFKTKSKRDISIDKSNHPSSISARLSADSRELFIIASKGADGLTKIFMYNPESCEERLVVECKSVTQLEYYAKIVPLPGDKYPNNNLFTYDGYRIKELTADPKDPIIYVGGEEEGDFDPFDEELINKNGDNNENFGI